VHVEKLSIASYYYVQKYHSFIFRRYWVQNSDQRLTILTDFSVFLDPSREMLGQYLKLGHNHSFPYP
jgi:hypothetical protein